MNFRVYKSLKKEYCSTDFPMPFTWDIPKVVLEFGKFSKGGALHNLPTVQRSTGSLHHVFRLSFLGHSTTCIRSKNSWQRGSKNREDIFWIQNLQTIILDFKTLKKFLLLKYFGVKLMREKNCICKIFAAVVLTNLEAF